LHTAIELAEYLRNIKYQPEQVQDFYPTPGTLSTTMFYTGLDPLTMEKVYIPKTKTEKAMQRALLQYRNPRNYDLVHEALIKAGREDLIGFGARCLIKPRDARRRNENYGKFNKKSSGNSNNRNNKKSNDKQKGKFNDKSKGKFSEKSDDKFNTRSNKKSNGKFDNKNNRKTDNGKNKSKGRKRKG